MWYQVASKLLTLFEFAVFWAGFPFGWNLLFSLGWTDFINFLGWPVFAGYPTYGVLVTYLLSGVIVVRILLGKPRTPTSKRGPWTTLFVGVNSETAVMLGAAFYGYGLLLAASPFSIYPHYLIVVFPMQYVGLSRLALWRGSNPIRGGTGRLLLLTLCSAKFLTSVLFLYYIHVNGGAPGGDYGVSYGVRYAPK